MKKRILLVSGFTLIELIVVIAILAVLGLLIAPKVLGTIEESQRIVCSNNLNLVHRAYLVARAKEENVSMKTVIANVDGEYFSGVAECPKYKTTYKAVYLDNVSCLDHKISTVGTLSEYDLYIMDKMDSLLENIDKCLAIQKKEDRNKCLSDATGGVIVSDNGIRNDTMRDTLLALYGGTWPKMDDNILKAAGINTNGKTYYYQPFFTTGTNVEILFASENSGADKNWNSQLFFFEGTWYKSSKVTGGFLPDLANKTAAQIRELFKNQNEFTVVNY